MGLTDFKGAARRLDDIDLPRIGAQIGVGEDELHAFIDVESLGSGFYPNGSVKRLFEPHVFYRQLKGTERDDAVKAGLAYPRWGTQKYPKDSTERIIRAMAINEEAALRATSWGAFQVLGENYAMAGFDSAKSMVLAMLEDEETHLQAAVNFMVAAGIDDDLRRLAELDRPTRPEDCIAIVRVYNGPGYAKNDYHTKFAKAHNKWRQIADTPYDPNSPETAPARPVEPAVAVPARRPGPITATALLAAQKRLLALGYTEVGMPDGKWGSKTRSAVLAFRADHGLDLIAEIDDTFLAALMTAEPREVSEERAEATISDLREQGSRIIKSTDNAQGGAVAIGGLGGIGVAIEAMDQLSSRLDVTSGLLAKMEPLKQAALALGPWMMLLLACFVGYNLYRARQARLDDHRSGKTAAPDRHAVIRVQR
jgi:peptidoglycan hydrolase-like protein with peptidoglycan-binding domain